MKQLNLFTIGYAAVLLIVLSCTSQNKASNFSIDLSGEWLFRMDSLDAGINQQWYNKKLSGSIRLPGSMATNNLGNDITLHTPWTGQIVDSSYFSDPEYAPYRQPGNIKIPFWLQPVKYYKGAAWYQKKITIPASWKNRNCRFFIERSHWETMLWFDDKSIGMQNSLGTPHLFDLGTNITPGEHTITVRIDNRVKDINVGQNSHSISDHTQGNWNGMIGKMYIATGPLVYIDDVQLFPDIDKKIVRAHISIKNTSGNPVKGSLQLHAYAVNSKAGKLKNISQEISIQKDSNHYEIDYSMGENPLLWDEFNPHLYTMELDLKFNGQSDNKSVSFGMRKFHTIEKHFAVNNHITFLRGTLECAIFPLTGYPPTDVASWKKIFEKVKAYGLNHMRFHSWCPPEAAFIAADETGVYLQVEVSSWANQGAEIGSGRPLDKYIYDESQRMIKWYGNHPSFCMLTYGNEPAGKNINSYLTGFVNYWKQKDNRRIYTTAAGWPVLPASDYNCTPDPRIQLWGDGLKSIINSKAPSTDYDWRNIISKWPQPTVSHEIGQWCVYPDFKEIAQYTGVMKAKNFEIFRDFLNQNGIGHLADSFVLASGKLQALCYKADIEAALRTPGFGGFQLLDLHDFPGQGTALVGVLNPFWKEKGYITAEEYSRFCNAVVPLVRFPKMIYTNNETLNVPVEIAQFRFHVLKNANPLWRIQDASGKTRYEGKLKTTDIPLGNVFSLGNIQQSLIEIKQAERLVLTVSVGDYQNSWDFFVYPESLPAIKDDILVKQVLDDEVIDALNKGGKVLLTIKKGALKKEYGGDIQIGFSSIFWNTAWTLDQPPTTLGILCNPNHPALKHFSTQYYSNWQWWDAMTHSSAVILDSVAKGIQPIIRVIDDWTTARSLGLAFQCRVENGKLLLTSIDLVSDLNKRPEARQLLFSFRKYMRGSSFNPLFRTEINKLSILIQQKS